ncbi:MAG: hypothetical protein IKZ87_08725 [Actinomycetaceae bacterium]|nr:hypothetical protein [Actinomycetaceae bacterium]
MTSSITIRHDKPIRFLPGSTGFSAVYSYVDGKKTENQLEGEHGLPMWQSLRSRAELFGEVLDDVSIVVESAIKPELKETGLLASCELMPPIALTIRARANNGWGDLAIKATGALKGDK